MSGQAVQGSLQLGQGEVALAAGLCLVEAGSSLADLVLEDLVQDVLLLTLEKLRAGEIRDP